MIAYSPLDTGDIPIGRIPKDMLAKYEMTPAQLMLNWVTYMDPVVAIPKAGRVSHVEENARSIDVRISSDGLPGAVQEVRVTSRDVMHPGQVGEIGVKLLRDLHLDGLLQGHALVPL